METPFFDVGKHRVERDMVVESHCHQAVLTGGFAEHPVGNDSLAVGSWGIGVLLEHEVEHGRSRGPFLVVEKTFGLGL